MTSEKLSERSASLSVATGKQSVVDSFLHYVEEGELEKCKKLVLTAQQQQQSTSTQQLDIQVIGRAFGIAAAKNHVELLEFLYTQYPEITDNVCENASLFSKEQQSQLFTEYAATAIVRNNAVKAMEWMLDNNLLMGFEIERCFIDAVHLAAKAELVALYHPFLMCILKRYPSLLPTLEAIDSTKVEEIEGIKCSLRYEFYSTGHSPGY